MIKTILPLAALTLSACATTPPPFDDDGDPRVIDPAAQACDADAAQGLIGTMASSEVGARLLELTGARTLRWAPPRAALTMDYRSDRLTVYYDDDLRIERITCG
ncbi:I78 family peptidase inhibitor [Aurantiacibacter odishensis]|uniref:I78 family peptidase inhibitor n=1 Tax=Aurantiacibacter odishensis TaxID=1155476 RepID=UPI000E7653BF|nr:I78 family peptidase inhibitor [Aurantiacibacter odishensis]